MDFARPSSLDQLLRPLHRWVWHNSARRGRKLLRFAQTEADGSRDLSRAAERTSDGLLRRLYLRHANDEQRHADVFRKRARALLRGPLASGVSSFEANWLSPGERGLDELRVDGAGDDSLLAFLHLSEKSAAGRFAIYREVLTDDPETRAVFADVLRDEVFHMNYTETQLARVAPATHRLRLWQARAGRLWKAYLRIAVAIAGMFGTALLWIQYAVLLPPFALMAKRAAHREPKGWVPARPPTSLKSQY